MQESLQSVAQMTEKYEKEVGESGRVVEHILAERDELQKSALDIQRGLEIIPARVRFLY